MSATGELQTVSRDRSESGQRRQQIVGPDRAGESEARTGGGAPAPVPHPFGGGKPPVEQIGDPSLSPAQSGYGKHEESRAQTYPLHNSESDEKKQRHNERVNNALCIIVGCCNLACGIVAAPGAKKADRALCDPPRAFFGFEPARWGEADGTARGPSPRKA